MRANDRSIPGALLVLVLLAGGLATAAVLAWRRSAPRRPPPILSRAPDGTETSPQPAWPVVRIDVNAANEAELTLLPGIGPALAARIVTDREQHGPFATLDDLQRVRGIGPVTVEQIADLAVAGGVPETNSKPAEASDDQRE